MSVNDILFWERVEAYISKLTQSDYEVEHALRAAVLRFDVTMDEILKYCNFDGSQGLK